MSITDGVSGFFIHGADWVGKRVKTTQAKLAKRQGAARAATYVLLGT
jgi:hypothetical protein